MRFLKGKTTTPKTNTKGDSDATSGINSGFGRYLLTRYNEREFQILMSLNLTGGSCPNFSYFFQQYYD